MGMKDVIKILTLSQSIFNHRNPSITCINAIKNSMMERLFCSLLPLIHKIQQMKKTKKNVPKLELAL
jgi:hypothetical protein